MWPMLLGLIVAALVVWILSPGARRGIGWTAAVVVGLVVLAIGADVSGSSSGSVRIRAQKRIAASEVRLDDLELSGLSGDNKAHGLLTTCRPRYTLLDAARFIVEAASGACHQQARGRAES